MLPLVAPPRGVTPLRTLHVHPLSSDRQSRKRNQRGALADSPWTAWSSFSSTGPYMEMLLLANVATQFNEELEYDPLEGKIVNNAEADALLRRPYRAGWSL